MRLVGLISGGKDSIYNLLQCVSAGHDIVAVANVEPATEEELDSYMYQTVGHELISLMAGALCLPIFRQKTKGKAITLNKIYSRTSNDEVEDLTALLTDVKKAVKIDGVAVGAIASDYQRTRVENVCSRLGLKCFSYLWKRNQTELLEEMINAEIEAIIVKVACIGLNASHLGMTIREIQPYLLELHKKYGVNVCGEGGEYETITLDCPLFHRSITITETKKIISKQDDFAPTGILIVKKANLALKSWEPSGTAISLTDKIKIICSSVKDPYAFVQDCVDELSEVIFPQRKQTTEDLPFPFDPDDDNDDDDDKNSATPIREYWKGAGLSTTKVLSSTTVSRLDTTLANLHFSSGWCCIGNVTAPSVAEALQVAQRHLERMNYNFHEVVFVNLFVKNMDDFDKINAIYSQHMPETQPPARACVEIPLPAEVGVQLSVIAHKNVSKCKRAVGSSDLSERESLHVQSISHWAPANIGPYSQCVTISGIYFVAGQIPLIPGTMEILNKPILHQCRLALRHVLRILQAMNSKLHFSNVLHAICYVTSEEFVDDIHSLWSYITKVSTTPVAVVVVKKLPKKAQIEWEVIATSSKIPSAREEIVVVEQLRLKMKVCVYRDHFSSGLVCKISNAKSKSITGKSSNFTSTALYTALRLCVEALRSDSKKATPLCILKLFHQTNNSTIVSDVVNEVIPSFQESKVIATSIPVVACEDSDTYLTVSGVCM